MNKVNIKNELKEKYIIESKISGISFLISYLAVSSFILMILFLMAFLDPSNDYAPIFMVIFGVTFIISLITGLVYNIKKNKTRGNVDFFEEKDQHEFLKKYLVTQIVMISILFLGLIILVLGLAIKYKEGITLSFIGLLLVTISISIAIYNSIKRNMLKTKKSEILDDVISEYSFYNQLTLLERVILFVALIIIVVLVFSIIADSTRVFLNIVLAILGVLFSGYNIYNSIKCKVNYDKNHKKHGHK